jgi:ABC-type dipeptide/oligopeptide/nickel transport system permease component
MAMPPPQPESERANSPSLTPEKIAAQKAQERQMRMIIATGIGIAVIILLGLGFGIFALLQPGTPTARIRDIFIIIVALETFVIGVALVVLLIQLASLINLLQNEVRPILKATNETVNTLRGTAEFLGESVVEPVIKLNGYLASIQRVLELMGLKQK